MAEIVYVLCAGCSVLCASVLLRGHGQTRSHLLLWSSVCFGLLALNNVILVVDMVLLPDVDFGGGFFRNLTGAVAGFLLLFGLIWELV
jgi:hypothetical protein